MAESKALVLYDSKKARPRPLPVKRKITALVSTEHLIVNELYYKIGTHYAPIDGNASEQYFR